MRKILQFVILMGLVSLLADVVYEGARSVVGPFLATLYVSATLVGFISGFSEFVGYASRIIFGFTADKIKRYWLLTFIGYGLILSIPFIALTKRWEIVAIILALERLGKAIRTPARDTILSTAVKQIGRGFGFGLHEALDQIGAIAGPIFIAFALSVGVSYSYGFLLLLIPAILSIAFLGFARISYPTRYLEVERVESRITKTFWLYTLFIFFTTIGFVNFQILSYHLKVKAIVSDEVIPLLYALAMGLDAIFALILGKVYDRIGFKILYLMPILTTLIPLAFLSDVLAIVLALVVFGIVVSMHEAIVRAAVADLVGISKRATAYGILYTSYGFAFFLGSLIVGSLYEFSILAIFIFVIVFETLAIVTLYISISSAL